jgi:hypothetical protein
VWAGLVEKRLGGFDEEAFETARVSEIARQQEIQNQIY